MIEDQRVKQKMYLTAESIYKFLLGLDDNIDTLVLCKSSEIQLITTDQSIYEALGSIEEKSQIDFNKFVKLMEVAEVLSFAKSMSRSRYILTNKRVDEIRKKSENKNQLRNMEEEK